MSGRLIQAFSPLEKMYGTEQLCKAIQTASNSNRYPRLSFNFVKAVLENQKGGVQNGKSVGDIKDEWEHKRPDWL